MPSAKEEFDELMRDKGHRANHPEDDGAQSFLNISSDEDAPSTLRARRSTDSSDEDVAPPRPSMSTARIPQKRYGANTGPKGVISDAQDFRDSRREHRRSVQNLPPPHHPPSVRTPARPIREESDDELDEELNDDFMDSWRESRLQQLRRGAYESDMHQNGRKAGRLCGSVQKVDTEGYLHAVDGPCPDTVVAVYIFDEHSEVSALLEDCLRELARKHLDVHFIKLDYRDAEMEPAGVPALLAYRNGDMFVRLVPLVDDIPEDADVCATTLEDLFKRYGSCARNVADPC